jgi:ribosomal protein L7Ae-like RNA K-turn-binding protein
MQPETKKILSLLGLAYKSRNLTSGGFMTEKVIKKGTAELVIVTNDASENTKKLFRNKCEFYEVPLYIFSNSEELGHAIGKEARVSLAVTDSGFARTLRNLLDKI